ncbi:uncharacterized protein K02A2.6-like [Homarus americanus]|uniref:uncharacterized protein K02A2.6-like n=1 Tax=Homarus americanus TaxID=6706 RepID=UPI001C474D75|nr:uncharacterized protein K02A2.6-like [Homarus americanus]
MIGTATYVSKIDLLRGYYQVTLTHNAQGILVVVTFQRMLNKITRNMEETKAHLEDIIELADTLEEHLRRLQHLFQQLQPTGLVINQAKCDFARGTVTYLGHIVGQGKTAPRTPKLDVTLNVSSPLDKRSLRRFLGMACF